ncbi:MAG: hypothetical protein H0U10_09470 [Chloroflexia bacterium]|nr:hypothetical protein [Chloroflexia bacterium]
MGGEGTPFAATAALAVLLALLAYPLSAAAHERWFVPGGGQSVPEWDRLFSLPVLIALASGVAAGALLALLQRLVGDPLWPRPGFSQRLEPSAPAILGVQTAIAMIFMASRLNLFVPNIELPRNLFGGLVAGITVVAAFSFITGLLTRLGAAITLALLLFTLLLVPWYQTLEQAVFAGIALYLLAVGRGVVRSDDRGEGDRTWFSDRLLPHALTFLRLGAGISIVTLALTEKLLDVELGLAFLREYPDFNLGRLFGFPVSDEQFVYLAGVVEMTAGIALLAGFLPRVVILALWIPFNLGIVFLPPQELIGHLPILSVMYVLLVRGTQGIPSPNEIPAADPYPTQQPTAATTQL